MEEQNGTKLSSKPLTGKKKLVNKLSVSFEILSSLKKNVSGIIQAQKKKKTHRIFSITPLHQMFLFDKSLVKISSNGRN